MGQLTEKLEYTSKQWEFFKVDSEKRSEENKQLLAKKEALLAEKKCLADFEEQLKKKMATMYDLEALNERWDESWQDARHCILHKDLDFNWSLAEQALDEGKAYFPCEADDFWAKKLGETPRPAKDQVEASPENVPPEGQAEAAPENVPPGNIPHHSSTEQVRPSGASPQCSPSSPKSQPEA